jgi:vesicle coat complex subunit
MCVLRLRELSEDIVTERSLVHELYHLLDDRDPQVTANAVQAILELQGEEGKKLLSTKSVVIKLLRRLRDFNEWSQCLVLGVVAEFKPENEQEMFEVMNFLDERLRHCNAALVLAAVKVALNPQPSPRTPNPEPPPLSSLPSRWRV